MLVPILRHALALVAVASVSIAAQAHAPGNAKAVQIIVPFGPGGGQDILARSFNNELGAALGQPVIVDNRPGGGGTIGVDIVAHAPADGHTVVFTTATIAVNVSLRPKAPFNVLRDLAPVTLVVTMSNLLVVHPALPAQSVRELLALAKSRPGTLNSASAGVGSSNHLALALFNTMTGAGIAHQIGLGPLVDGYAACHTQFLPFCF